MQLINADLHIHSRFSISTSKYMTFETLAAEAPKKGINLVGSGDCLHQTWLKELQSLEKVDDGTFELNDIRFIL
jgi:PHP family Zn ribbon phosphoesterase